MSNSSKMSICLLRPCVRLYQTRFIATAAVAIDFSSLKSTKSKLLAPSTSYHLSVSYPERSIRQSNNRLISMSCPVYDITQSVKRDVEENSFSLEHDDLKQEISAANFKDLAVLANKLTTTVHACLLLERLSILHKQGLTEGQNIELILQDKWLQKVLMLLDKNVTKIQPKLVVSCLQSLMDMTNEDIYIIKSLITQVLWLIRRIPMQLLIQVLQLHLNHQETPLRKSVVEHTLSVLERRWVELTKAKDIIYLMYLQGDIGNKMLMERLEDRALDLANQMLPKDLYRILYLLSKQGHRNMPLIHAVLYHMSKGSLSSLSVVQISNLLYACCSLNIFDIPLLEQVSLEIRNKQNEMTPKLASSMLTSFSRLRWSHDSSVQFLIEQLQKDLCKPLASVALNSVFLGEGTDENKCVSSTTLALSSSLDPEDKASVVLSLANLNCDRFICHELVEKIAGIPDIRQLRESKPVLWLDVVWSMAVLQVLEPAAASSVLTEKFWGTLPVSDSFQSIINMIKLSNINMAALFELEGYKGPLLPEALSNGDAKLLSRGERKSAKKIISALLNMAPEHSYTQLDTTATGGYLIDAVFYVDGNGQPVSLSQVPQKAKSIHRIAFKFLDFSDLTLPSSRPTGLHAMASRHLHHQGYTVVQIQHHEVSDKTKVVELVTFIQQKIRNALQEKLHSNLTT